jgi:hypothetical protein
MRTTPRGGKRVEAGSWERAVALQASGNLTTPKEKEEGSPPADPLRPRRGPPPTPRSRKGATAPRPPANPKN